MKNKVGFFLPSAIEQAFDEVADGMVGGKEKWLVISGAILLLLETGQQQRSELVRRVRAESGKDGDFDRLVSEAKSKGSPVARAERVIVQGVQGSKAKKPRRRRAPAASPSESPT